MNPAAQFGGGRGYRAGQITRKAQVGISVYYAGIIVVGSVVAGVIWCVQNPLPGFPLLIGAGWLIGYMWRMRCPRPTIVTVQHSPPPDPVIAQLLAKGHTDREARAIAKSCPWLYDLDDKQREEV